MQNSKKILPAALSITLSGMFFFSLSELPGDIEFNYFKENHKNIELPIRTAMEEAIPLVPFSTSSEVIRVKSSGEEVEKNEAAFNQFIERFGNDFNLAYALHQEVSHPFSVPEGIKKTVQFWVDVFSKYGKNHFVFHHPEEVGLVYSVIDLPQYDTDLHDIEPGLAKRLRTDAILKERARLLATIQEITKKLKKNIPLSTFENELAKKISDFDYDLEEIKKEDIRIQQGFSHRFKQAIRISGKYMQEMENIFAIKGLPKELTRLPFIESAFSITAVSSADAVGLWQFIPGTGKNYLNIDDKVDERLDPILSTYAAASHLATEYKLFHDWPLTINGYNTGPGRMQRAIKQLGTTDISKIIKEFKDPGYQFYSRNYFPEFLAAVHVYENYQKYFGAVERLSPTRSDYVTFETAINLKKLAEYLEFDESLLDELNPSISSNIMVGDEDLPAGYLVRVPHKMGTLFTQAARFIGTPVENEVDFASEAPREN